MSLNISVLLVPVCERTKGSKAPLMLRRLHVPASDAGVGCVAADSPPQATANANISGAIWRILIGIYVLLAVSQSGRNMSARVRCASPRGHSRNNEASRFAREASF